jgi:nucleotide-binding universal stress UspA family protein
LSSCHIAVLVAHGLNEVMDGERDGSTLLIATDGSEAAIDAAARSTELFPSARELVVVSVAEPSAIAHAALAGGKAAVASAIVADLWTDARADAKAAIARTVAALPTTAAVVRRVEHGDPGRVICQIAEDLGVDAIVVGSRGLGFTRRLLLGSVSTFVARNAPCPVLIVRPRDEEDVVEL